MDTPEYWIEKLRLEKHREGGFFRESYRSEVVLPREVLPKSFEGERAISTAIYFLLTADSFSAFHRIRSDEIWHFYRGSPLTLHMIDSEGSYSEVKLGIGPDNGGRYQYAVDAGTWFAAEVDDPGGFALVGCTVAPGFDFADFELAARDDLAAQCPEFSEVISRLTRQ